MRGSAGACFARVSPAGVWRPAAEATGTGCDSRAAASACDAPEGRDIEVGSDGASEEGYLDVVLCHSAGGDAAGYTQGYYISFDLEPIAGELEGMKGIKLRIDTFENGTKYIKLDLPQEK